MAITNDIQNLKQWANEEIETTNTVISNLREKITEYTQLLDEMTGYNTPDSLTAAADLQKWIDQFNSDIVYFQSKLGDKSIGLIAVSEFAIE